MGNVNEVMLFNYRARYIYSQNPNRKTMIFLMGSLQEIESITYFNQEFSEAYNYIALELPGSGNTEPLHPKHGVCFLSDCLAEFVERLELQDIYLVACSYATAIALEYVKLPSHRVEKLVLAGSMKDIPVGEWPTMLQLMRDCAFDTPKFANGFIDLLTQEGCGIERQGVIRKAAVRKAAQYKEENFWHFVFNTIRLMCYEPRDLEKINVPCLVFTGEFDPYVTPQRSCQLAEELRYGRIEIIEGADHLFHIEKPNETVRLICSFLEGGEERSVA